MHVQRKLRGALIGFDEERAHGDVGDEVAVHHVDVNPIGAALLAGRDLLLQAQVVG